MDITSSLKNQDIIIIGQQPWDTEIGSNCKNIAIELSNYNRVLYVNSPLDRISYMRSKNDFKVKRRLDVIRGTQPGLIEIKLNLWNLYPDCLVESINWIGSTKVFSFFNKLNNRRLAKSILKSVRDLGFTNFILFNDNEIFKAFYLKELLNPVLSIYYSRDYMLGVDYWKKHGKILEPLLIKKSNICFANSEYLASFCREFNANSFNIGQGCDVESFKKIADTRKGELSNISIPIIGYIGALNSERLDIEIIHHIAKNFEGFLIVLIGPEDSKFRESQLHALKNVLFLGQRDVSLLPELLNNFDICINPQLVNQITIGNYPRKVDEYLALGKPVIATRTKTMEAFQDYVYLAENKDEYIQLISRAFEENNLEKIEKRKRFAYSHTWGNCINEMNKQILLLNL